jgi:hypothetical protein
MEVSETTARNIVQAVRAVTGGISCWCFVHHWHSGLVMIATLAVYFYVALMFYGDR